MYLTLDQEQPSLAENNGLLARFARRKGWFIAGAALTATVVFAAYTALPRSYRTTAGLVMAGNEAVLRNNASSAEAQRSGDPADIETQMLVLRSPRLARIILDEPKVQEALLADCKAMQEGTWFTQLVQRVLPPAGCGPQQFTLESQLRRLEGGFSIGPTGRSRVIEVSFVSPVPEAAATIANALVDAYLNDDKERKVDTHDNAIHWLTTEIERSGEELRKAELSVEKYRNEHGIVRGQQASITSERLSALGQQLAAAQAAYAQALSRPPSGANDDAPEILSNATVADLKRQLAETESRAADLRARFGDQHPSVIAVTGQRRELTRRLEQEIVRVKSSLQNDVQSALARVADLKEQYAQLMQEVGQAGGAEAGIAILIRDVEARREIYVEMLKKLNTLQTERRLLTGDARLVNYAELPSKPWFPKKLPFIALGLVLSTAAGAGISLLRDLKDDTLRATSNLPLLAGTPIIGQIPWARRRRGLRGPAAQLENASPLQESIRALFGRLTLVPGRAPKTILTSSADTGEGKSFLAMALALFASASGRRVLLIEADLRRGSIGKAFDMPDGPGLSDYLRGDAMASDVVRQYRGLDVITAGKPSIDSTELLGNSRLDVLLRNAEFDYDMILVDSPPAMLLMDVHVLARRVDGVVFCASLGRSRLDRVLQGVRDLEASGGRMLGIVVSGGRGGESVSYDLPAKRQNYVTETA